MNEIATYLSSFIHSIGVLLIDPTTKTQENSEVDAEMQTAIATEMLKDKNAFHLLSIATCSLGPRRMHFCGTKKFEKETGGERAKKMFQMK